MLTVFDTRDLIACSTLIVLGRTFTRTSCKGEKQMQHLLNLQHHRGHKGAPINSAPPGKNRGVVSTELREARVKKPNAFSSGSSPQAVKVCHANPSDGTRLARSSYHCLVDLLMAGFQHNLLCHICSSSSHRSFPSPFFSWKLQQRSYLVSPPSLSSIALMHLVRLSVSETHFWISEPSRVCCFFFSPPRPPPASAPPKPSSLSPLVPAPFLLRL